MSALARHPRLDTALAASLCFACGSVDTEGFLQTGIFAANMTGNTVLAAISAAKLDFAAASSHVLAIAAFFAGAMLGRFLLKLTGGRTWLPISLEAAMLAIIALVSAPHAATVMLMAAAMGVQATAITRFHGISVSTVVLTSTLARMAEATADFVTRPTLPPAAAGRPPQSPLSPAPTGPPPMGLLALIWSCYALGAGAGVLAREWLRYPLLVPMTLAMAVAVALFTSGHSEDR